MATPIGNLEDITLRALRILRDEVSLIACEDTRQTQKLLSHFEIRKPLISYHEHNEAARTSSLISTLEQGESVALVSDAGTPLISDPGYRIVAAATERGLTVVPIPGSSALLAAIAGSGLPVDRFRFIGFLPAKTGARRRTFQELRGEAETVVAYESPHRIVDSLADAAEILGERPIVLARELTKVHEEFLRGSATTIEKELRRRPTVKGEITLVLGPAADQVATGDPVQEVERLESEGFERMEAIKVAAKRLRLPKREVYRLLSERASAEPDNNPPDTDRD